MAWKYRQEYVKDGDVVEPSDFRINVNEFGSEINGFLDSDNLTRNAVTFHETKRETFTEVFSNDLTSRFSYVFRHDESGWQKTALLSTNQDTVSTEISHRSPANSPTYRNSIRNVTEKTKLPSTTFIPNQDGLLICELSAFVDWLPFCDGSDGKPLSINSFFGDNEGDYLLYSYFAKQNKRYKQVNAFVLSSMWRLTVNGQSVAETGPIGNDYRTHPIYLCGATPVLKNQETVVQLEAQFVWYSMGRDVTIPSAAFDPKTKSTEAEISYRHDCSLNCPMLITTYRKR